MASGNIPATGVQTTPGPNGSVPIRREIRDLQANFKDQFNLYVLGLRELQKTPPAELLSYYQIAGIHGEPFVPWNDVQGNSDAAFGGYCTHSSILFLTWHRPYLALYEQVLYAKVQQVASSYRDPQLRQKYTAAAQGFRIPYWDWAAPAGSQSAFPRSVSSRNITVVDTDGATRSIANPLASFNFSKLDIPSDLALDSDWSQYPATQRNPNVSAVITNENASLRNNVSVLLLSYTLFDAFSNNAWSRNGQAGDYGSVENIHDAIHDQTGGGFQMSSLSVSAFDPVFWLHHANVDRLWAIWQALNPSAFTINKVASARENNFFIDQGEQLSASTQLKPFWDASGTQFWTSTDTKETIPFGYAYPETQIWNYPTPQQYQAAVRASAVALYGANVISNFFANVDVTALQTGAPAAPLVGAAAPVVEPAEHPALTTQFKKKAVAAEQPEEASHNPSPPKELTPDPVPAPLPAPLATPKNPLGVPEQYAHVFKDNKYTEWITNLRAIKHGLAQTFRVFIFLGDFNPLPASWPTEPNMVGRFTVLGRAPSTQCDKCKSDNSSDLVVTGTVPLTAALLTEVVRGRLSGLNDHDEVVEYLKRNLHWRVTGFDGSEIDRAQVPGLRVGVVSTEVAVGPDGVPVYGGEYRVHQGVSDGRPAGFGEGDQV